MISKRLDTFLILENKKIKDSMIYYLIEHFLKDFRPISNLFNWSLIGVILLNFLIFLLAHLVALNTLSRSISTIKVSMIKLSNIAFNLISVAKNYFCCGIADVAKRYIWLNILKFFIGLFWSTLSIVTGQSISSLERFRLKFCRKRHITWVLTVLHLSAEFQMKPLAPNAISYDTRPAT